MLQQMALAPITTPALATATNNNQYSQSHNHNNSYNINVSATVQNSTPDSIGNAIKNRIVDTKAIEKANVNKVVPPYRDS